MGTSTSLGHLLTSPALDTDGMIEESPEDEDESASDDDDDEDTTEDDDSGFVSRSHVIREYKSHFISGSATIGANIVDS